MNLFWIIIAVLAIQRLLELLIARRNERIARANGAREYDEKGYKVIVLMHIAFFISLISEYVFFGKSLSHYWIVLLILFLLAQVLRYWAISTLGFSSTSSNSVAVGPFQRILPSEPINTDAGNSPSS